eukprot:10439974-Alexandrium_andersonii.AAC.1
MPPVSGPADSKPRRGLFGPSGVLGSRPSRAGFWPRPRFDRIARRPRSCSELMNGMVACQEIEAPRT